MEGSAHGNSLANTHCRHGLRLSRLARYQRGSDAKKLRCLLLHLQLSGQEPMRTRSMRKQIRSIFLTQKLAATKLILHS
jgi:hypothetical protein